MKVNLKIKNRGPFIVAPIHCPYKVQEQDIKFDSYQNEQADTDKEIFTVNSSICPLCKLCEFIPEINDTQLVLNTEGFTKYLTLLNEEVSKSIRGQVLYLQKENRLPIAILISPVIFDSMLKLTYKDSQDQYYLAYSYFINNEVPICYITGCPVYLSRKLTKSLIQVVGEVEWR